MLIIAKPAMRNRNTDIRIITEVDEPDVEPKSQIKVLGWEINSRLSMDTSLQKTMRKIKLVMMKVKTR